jgi:hypothetical protein
VLAPGRPLHPPYGRRTASGGAKGTVQPIRDCLEAAHDTTKLLEQLAAPLGLLGLGKPICDGFDRVAQRAKSTQGRVEIEAEALRPDWITREAVVESLLSARQILEPLVQSSEERFAGAASIGDGRQQSLMQQVETGPAQEVTPALELVG